MNNFLIRKGLFLLLKEVAQNPGVQYDSASWEKAYESSYDQLTQFSDEESAPLAIRIIDHARIEVDALAAQIEVHKNIDPAAMIHCRKMAETLRAELRLLTLKVSHPEIYQHKQSPISPLQLNDGYHITDFIELITPLFELGFFKTTDSDPARLKIIISAFERAFNVSMPNYNILRSAALNRKIHLTPLLDKMRDVMIRLSQQ